ncbi:MAG: helix-turn-helix transcriptional regulator [Candidatus Izemoplasma sp.]
MINKIDISDFTKISTEQSIKHDLIIRFKMRRKESKLTQRALSIMSGVSYGSIRRFEVSGDISLHALLKLSRVLGTIDDFNNIFDKQITTNIKDM